MYTIVLTKITEKMKTAFNLGDTLYQYTCAGEVERMVVKEIRITDKEVRYYGEDEDTGTEQSMVEGVCSTSMRDAILGYFMDTADSSYIHEGLAREKQELSDIIADIKSAMLDIR